MGAVKVQAVRPFRVRDLVVGAGDVAKLELPDAERALESGRGRLVNPDDEARIVEYRQRETAAALKAAGPVPPERPPAGWPWRSL